VYRWREGCREEEHESSAVFFADVLVENGGLEGFFGLFSYVAINHNYNYRRYIHETIHQLLNGKARLNIIRRF